MKTEPNNSEPVDSEAIVRAIADLKNGSVQTSPFITSPASKPESAGSTLQSRRVNWKYWASSPEALARREKAIEMRKDGLSIGIIAKDLGRPATEVCQVLLQAGLGGMRARFVRYGGKIHLAKNSSSVDPIKVLELRESKNYTYEMIAKELGSSTAMVRDALERIGGKRARSYRKGKYWIDKDRVLELFRQGKNRTEIVRQLSSSTLRINQVLEEAGFELPKPKVIDADEVRRLYMNGMSTSEISRYFEIYSGRIRTVIQSFGLQGRAKLRRAEVIRLHELGANLTEIAKETMMDPSQVYRILKQEIGSDFTKASLTDLQRDRIIALKQVGKSTQEIAAEVGTLVVTVQAELRRAGFQVQKMRPPSPDRVAKLRIKGHTVQKIARTLRTSNSLVARALKRKGLVKRQKKWSKAELLELGQLKALGFTQSQLAEHYKVTVGVMRRAIQMSQIGQAFAEDTLDDHSLPDGSDSLGASAYSSG